MENRVSSLEHHVTKLRIDIAEIKAILPTVAKQEDDIATIKAKLPYFATHADISRLLMWLIGIGFTSLVSIVFGILNYLK